MSFSIQNSRTIMNNNIKILFKHKQSSLLNLSPIQYVPSQKWNCFGIVPFHGNIEFNSHSFDSISCQVVIHSNCQHVCRYNLWHIIIIPIWKQQNNYCVHEFVVITITYAVQMDLYTLYWFLCWHSLLWHVH